MTYIALSDGHGKDTPGKRSPDGMRENEFNSRVVYWLDIYLRHNGFKTLLVSPATDDTPLKTRTTLANSKKVDLYFSIHANAMNGVWGNARGIEVLVYKSGSSSESKAKVILKHLLKGSEQVSRGIKYRDDLHELRATNMDAVLVECGFMDNLEEVKLLKSEAFRKECAKECTMALCEIYKTKYTDMEQTEMKQPPTTTKKKYYRVVTGSFEDKKQADTRVSELTKKGYESFIDVYEK